jgi:D-alanyl-lipoteichoic acid acyltransferase DltB (MBOAT superfamily)
MALGTARLFGIELIQNFNAPYLANSIADFWRRWHISFSRWILDYIFKPLQMHWRNWKNGGTAAALIVTFLLSGIWHGPTWGFVLWGLLHGLYLASSVFYKPVQKQIHKILRIEKTRILECWEILVTFNLVCFAWIFFRSNTVADTCYIIPSMARDFRNILDMKYVRLQFRGLGLDDTDLLLSLFFVSIVVIVNVLELKKVDIWDRLSHQSVWVRWFVYYVITCSIIYFAPYNTAKNFIYMQF